MGESSSSSSSLSLTQQIGVAPLIKRLSKHLTRKFAKIFFILSNHKIAGSLGALAGFVIASVFAWKFVRATAGQRRRRKQTSDAAVEATKAVLGKMAKNKFNGARKMTCQLLGVILEESSPEELQHHATLRPSVVEVLLEISRFCDIYLIEKIVDDESGERVLLALENSGLFKSGGLMKDKVLFCSTDNGRLSFVRQLEPDWHVDTNPDTLSQLAKFIRFQLYISPSRSSSTSESNIFNSKSLESFFNEESL
ncbi:peroxisome biogenesis protein 22-like isoform X1 [Castanea sativa]|uniref:peroxisome biogenesis protein 22-like isoform X1 n=1 Tax=Castanea sativa TaxID=21020 RepID=UPI003F64DC29